MFAGRSRDRCFACMRAAARCSPLIGRYHRRAIVEKMGEAPQELEFTARILEGDAKNYHAWAHRQWTQTTFGISEADELAFVDRLLLSDVRNNSAWNQRWFTIERTSKVGCVCAFGVRVLLSRAAAA